MRREKSLNIQRWRRSNRVRKRVRGDAQRPRLTVFRSNANLYCQIVDDQAGCTLISASTNDKDLRGQFPKSANKEAAQQLGRIIAERALAAGIARVCFDRGSYKYHGRVAELATAARAAGLSF